MSNYDGYGEAPRRRGRQKQREESRKYEKRRRSPVRRFFKIVLTVALLYFAALLIFAYTAHISPDPNDKPLDVLTGIISDVPERTNFLIMCTDKDGSRTDTIMVGCYNSKTNGLDIISIPRDTIVTVSDEHFERMQLEYPQPDSPEMQINHIHHFIGEKDGPEVLASEVENMLDIDIDYYVRVNFEAFRYFVDSIGGISFDVPVDMYYRDPAQDLYIDLNAGVQLLDGDKAEQLVRYRSGYSNGDIGRIEVQQEFLRALVKKAVSSETVTSNPKAYINTFLKYVTTNATIADALKYASEFKKLDVNNMNTYLLPGEAYNRYYCDEEETSRLVYEIFKRPSEEILENRTENGGEAQPSDSRGASIQVLNGGYTDGKAGEVRDMLTSDGYTVSDIATYSDIKKEQTRIYVNRDGIGEDLTSYFKDAEVIRDSQITGDYDIVIIIGTEE